MTRDQYLGLGAKLLRDCIKYPESKPKAAALDAWRQKAKPSVGEVEQVRLMARSSY